MTGTTSGVERGCGYREQGGAYVECGLDEDGAPVEEFLIDPPVEYEPDTKIGQELVKRHGTVHVFDWIGSTHYPYTADFVEEVRRYGLSRRISTNLDVSRFSADSRIICIHARARFEGVDEDPAVTYGDGPVPPEKRCAKYAQADTPSEKAAQAHLEYPTAACTMKWWWDAPPDDKDSERMHRTVASFGYSPVYGVDMPEPVPAVFASFPISNVCVIRADDGSHEETAQQMSDKLPDDANIPLIISEA
jgi:hypothetical protein